MSGPQGLWDKFTDITDIQGKYRAYKVLGLESETEFDKVTERYKELVGEWDPETPQGQNIKSQEEYMRYYKAYKVLQKVYKWKKYYNTL